MNLEVSGVELSDTSWWTVDPVYGVWQPRPIFFIGIFQK